MVNFGRWLLLLVVICGVVGCKEKKKPRVFTDEEIESYRKHFGFAPKVNSKGEEIPEKNCIEKLFEFNPPNAFRPIPWGTGLLLTGIIGIITIYFGTQTGFFPNPFTMRRPRHYMKRGPAMIMMLGIFLELIWIFETPVEKDRFAMSPITVGVVISGIIWWVIMFPYMVYKGIDWTTPDDDEPPTFPL